MAFQIFNAEGVYAYFWLSQACSQSFWVVVLVVVIQCGVITSDWMTVVVKVFNIGSLRGS